MTIKIEGLVIRDREEYRDLGAFRTANGEFLVKDGNFILTDRFNRRAVSVGVGNFRLILPGCCIASTGGAIGIKRYHRKPMPARYSLYAALWAAVKDRSFCDGVLVSGGIDSSIIAALACKIKPSLNLISAGFEMSEDFAYAELLGRKLGKTVQKIVLSDEIVLETVVKLKALGLGTYSTILGVVEYICADYAKRAGMSSLMSGLGSDELFFGFQKHRKTSRNCLAEMRKDRMAYLAVIDLARVAAIGQALGLSVYFPYLDDRVVDYALSIDINKIDDNLLYDKGVLREVGKDLGLSTSLSKRRKLAMQYGSGVMRSLERSAKKAKVKNVGDFIKMV